MRRVKNQQGKEVTGAGKGESETEKQVIYSVLCRA